MTRVTEEIVLASPSPGTRRSLKVHRYGSPGVRPKAYFHAALHADEWPGLLTLNHLTGLLGARVEKGELMAELIDVEADDPAKARTPIYSRASGLFFARKADTLARSGNQIGKIAGAEPLTHRKSGNLLSP